MPRSVRTTVPPDAASAAAGRLAGNARVIKDAGQQGQRELTGILANPALSGGFLIRALELIRVATGADTASVLRACDDPTWLAVVAGAGDPDQPRVALVPADGPLDLARTPAVHGDMSGERSPVHAVCGYPGRSLATAPLIASGFIIGLLAVAARNRSGSASRPRGSCAGPRTR